jgi:hypothetical protein
MRSTKASKQVRLPPDAPGLDEDSRRRRRALAEMQEMSSDELFALAVRAGIYTHDGKLTPPYRQNAKRGVLRRTGT